MDSEIVKTKEGEALQLIYLSKDGEENYPGNLEVRVLYSLNDHNELKLITMEFLIRIQ